MPHIDPTTPIAISFYEQRYKNKIVIPLADGLYIVPATKTGNTTVYITNRDGTYSSHIISNTNQIAFDQLLEENVQLDTHNLGMYLIYEKACLIAQYLNSSNEGFETHLQTLILKPVLVAGNTINDNRDQELISKKRKINSERHVRFNLPEHTSPDTSSSDNHDPSIDHDDMPRP